ncbi:MAG TPA: hypothetical protein PLY87_16740 [Planctomycetaceae bacterium]|nr:hypothetical protein [Planctomycetaceae bacterium]HQZ66743.1 hypothetical protein [Planctomycetaceae bacterium]
MDYLQLSSVDLALVFIGDSCKILEAFRQIGSPSECDCEEFDRNPSVYKLIIPDQLRLFLRALYVGSKDSSDIRTIWADMLLRDITDRDLTFNLTQGVEVVRMRGVGKLFGVWEDEMFELLQRFNDERELKRLCVISNPRNSVTVSEESSLSASQSNTVWHSIYGIPLGDVAMDLECVSFYVEFPAELADKMARDLLFFHSLTASEIQEHWMSWYVSPLTQPIEFYRLLSSLLPECPTNFFAFGSILPALQSDEYAAVRDALQKATTELQLFGSWLQVTGLWSKRPIEEHSTPAKSADTLETQREENPAPLSFDTIVEESLLGFPKLLARFRYIKKHNRAVQIDTTADDNDLWDKPEDERDRAYLRRGWKELQTKLNSIENAGCDLSLQGGTVKLNQH